MEPKRLVLPIESKAVTDTGDGEITGLAAVYGNVDLQDDMFEPGAFAKSASDWSRAKTRLPLLDWHGKSIDGIIGSVTQLKSVPEGLWFRAGFTKDARGQRARQLARDGHLSGVSVGWLPVRQPQIKAIDGKAVQVIGEAKVHEISLTPIPANPLAQLVSVKSLDGDDKAANAPYGDVAYADPGYQDDGQKRYPIDTEAHCRAAWSYINQADNAAKYSSKELARIKGRIRAALKRYGVQVSESSSLDFATFAELARKALEIGHEMAAKAAFDALLSDYTMAAGPADGLSTADAAVTTDDPPAGDTVAPPDDAAAYALRLITPPGPRDDAPDGKPHDQASALAYPQQLLNVVETANQQADLDRLEAEINQALGRATA
jgi:HK97 family phage prohead protease